MAVAAFSQTCHPDLVAWQPIHNHDDCSIPWSQLPFAFFTAGFQQAKLMGKLAGNHKWHSRDHRTLRPCGVCLTTVTGTAATVIISGRERIAGSNYHN